MVGSIDPRCETVRGTHWPKKVAWLFGARVAETILASGPKSPHQQAGHMDASDPIRPSKKLLWHGGRPHMGPCFRRDDKEQLNPLGLHHVVHVHVGGEAPAIGEGMIDHAG